MIIATAYYDSNDVLVLPDFVVPPVFQEDRITTDVGYWHRYSHSFDDPVDRAVALQALCEDLKYFDARPYDVEMTVTFPGSDPAWVNAAQRRGMTIPAPDEPYYNLNVTYVVEDAQYTPHFRRQNPEFVDENFRMPHDPVVQAFCTRYKMDPLDFADRQRQKLLYEEFKVEVDRQQLNPAYGGAEQDSRLPLYIDTPDYIDYEYEDEMGVAIDYLDIDDVMGIHPPKREHNYSTDGSNAPKRPPKPQAPQQQAPQRGPRGERMVGRKIQYTPIGYDPETGRKLGPDGKPEDPNKIVLSLF